MKSINYEIKENETFGSKEVYFDGKPSAAVRDALKELRFRWNAKKMCWYGFADAEQIENALDGKSCAGTISNKKESEQMPENVSKDKEILREEYKKVWNSEKMVEYCTKKVYNFAIMENGTIIPVDKQTIKTRFCFGESGFDFDDAAAMAKHARTSTQYLKDQNMESFMETIKDIEEAETFAGAYVLVYFDSSYCSQTNDCKIGKLQFRRLTDVLEDLGGSARLSELYGKIIESRYDGKYHVMTKAEIETIKTAYKAAAAAHEKKVDAYIKRYGTSKVDSWTYWRDA